MFSERFIERFWARVDRSGECWVWTGYKTNDGYGRIHRSPLTQSKNVYTHRLSWEIANGPIPTGMCVCHTCDNPPCVRPEHLFLGTVADNNRDMTVKGRRVSTAIYGEQHHNAIATVEQVREIRRLAAAGVSWRSIATRLSLTQSVVDKILRRKNWTHIAE